MIASQPSLWLRFARMVAVLSMAMLLLGTISLLFLSDAPRAKAVAVLERHSLKVDQINRPMIPSDGAATAQDKGEVHSHQAITIVYSQPPSGTMFRQSSQLGYDRFGSDYDQYVWDDFTLSYTYAITEIDWRGEYLYNGLYGPITDFVVSLYSSTAAGWQPDVINPPLAQYMAGNTAGENPPWTSGPPVATAHDYQFVLPAPFIAEAGIKYWVQIEGIQPGPTDWGVVGGANGSGVLFYAIPGVGDFQYFRAPGDIAFTLLGPEIVHHWIYLPLISR